MKLNKICTSILYNNLKAGDVLGHSELKHEEYQGWVVRHIHGNIIKVFNKKFGKGDIYKGSLTIDGYGYRKVPNKE